MTESKKPTPWSPEEIATLRAMSEDRKQIADVAKVIQRSHSAIRAKAHTLRISLGGELRDRRSKDIDTCMSLRMDTRGEQGVRKCLRCRSDFRSDHRGNRTCQSCKERLTRDGGAGGYDEMGISTSPEQGHHVSGMRGAA